MFGLQLVKENGRQVSSFFLSPLYKKLKKKFAQYNGKKNLYVGVLQGREVHDRLCASCQLPYMLTAGYIE